MAWELFHNPPTSLSPVRVKTGKAQIEQKFSGLPPKADLRSARYWSARSMYGFDWALRRPFRRQRLRLVAAHSVARHPQVGGYPYLRKMHFTRTRIPPRTEEAIIVATGAPRQPGCPPWVVLGVKAKAAPGIRAA